MSTQPPLSSSTLRATQAPLKSQYTTTPASAKITLTSTGTLDGSGITCKLSTGAAVKSASASSAGTSERIAGLHPAAGGPDPSISGELCSGDLLLDALVACAGVTLRAVATALGLIITSGTVTAEGDLDFRGTLGVDRAAPVGITGIRLGFRVQFAGKEGGGEVGEDDVERLGRLTERYCVVLQTLVRKPEVSVCVVGGVGGEDGVEREVMYGGKC